uniref:Uncharacterized protein n=1 Tax=Anguilla anguilla TaxID=7936 RepID=A0A0E9TKU4_ANGAN
MSSRDIVAGKIALPVSAFQRFAVASPYDLYTSTHCQNKQPDIGLLVGHIQLFPIVTIHMPPL